METSLKDIFDKLNKVLVINTWKSSETHGLPSIKFTYYQGMKQWSHSVSLLYKNDKLTLFTSRHTNYQDLEKFESYSYNDREAAYFIPVSTVEDIVGILIKYDYFKLKLK